MSRRVIRCGLSTKDINKAIRELKQYKQEISQKMTTYRERVAEELRKLAKANFASSIVDDVINGSPRKPDVRVSIDNRGDISVVVALGEDAVWCEFGAGVYHNGSVGSSPNPEGGELGLTIGSYGKGYGKGQAWGYYDESGELVLTRGTPATMPLYNAAKEISQRAVEVAREVFG